MQKEGEEMKQLVEININPTPSLIEEEMWHKFDAVAQAYFLNCVVKRYRAEKANVIYQISAIADELHESYTKETSIDLIDFLEELISYIKDVERR